MALPSNVEFGLVTGVFIRGVADSTDADQDPQGVPIEGIEITFTPDIVPAIVRDAGATPPTTILLEPVVATTNAEGVLHVIGDTQPGVKLISGQDPDLDPSGWTYTVTMRADGFPALSFSFPLPAYTGAGTEVDLTTVIPVPADPGSALLAWEQAVSQTASNVSASTALRDETAQIRDDVVAFSGTNNDQVAAMVTTDGPTKTAIYNAIDGEIDATAIKPFAGATPLGPVVAVACAIRNTGSGFALISDVGHVPVGVASVSETADSIIINYDFIASRVLSLVVTPDETMALGGYTVGASVGLEKATINVGQTGVWGDYISYDATTQKLKSFNGLASEIVSHPTIAGWFQYHFNAPVTMTAPFVFGLLASRNPAHDVIFEGVGPSGGGTYGGFNFRFVDATTRADVVPPLADIKFWASLGSPYTRKVPPTELVGSGSNFWVHGLFELSSV